MNGGCRQTVVGWWSWRNSMRLQLLDEILDLDPSGAVFWPRFAMLIVADLHLEKGSTFARRGSLLPPYDSHATLGSAGGADRAAQARHGRELGRRLP